MDALKGFWPPRKPYNWPPMLDPDFDDDAGVTSLLMHELEANGALELHPDGSRSDADHTILSSRDERQLEPDGGPFGWSAISAADKGPTPVKLDAAWLQWARFEHTSEPGFRRPSDDDAARQ